MDSCASPLVTEDVHGYQSCESPCGVSEFIFGDGICIEACEEPFQLVVENGF